MYEHRTHRLLSWPKFLVRVGRHLLVALILIGIALGIGVAGYHWLGGLGWVDALLNASMILGGMGPVDTLKSDAATRFPSLYALFSGLAFIGVAGLMLAPFAHRLLHQVHLEEK